MRENDKSDKMLDHNENINRIYRIHYQKCKSVLSLLISSGIILLIMNYEQLLLAFSTSLKGLNNSIRNIFATNLLQSLKNTSYSFIK